MKIFFTIILVQFLALDAIAYGLSDHCCARKDTTKTTITQW